MIYLGNTPVGVAIRPEDIGGGTNVVKKTVQGDFVRADAIASWILQEFGANRVVCIINQTAFNRESPAEYDFYACIANTTESAVAGFYYRREGSTFTYKSVWTSVYVLNLYDGDEIVALVQGGE